jgi:alpha-ketoglutarate-dependent taurine dioxygenase
VDRPPGRPPTLWTEARRGPRIWAAENRRSLRRVVAEHGALLVRGVELRDADAVVAVFRELASDLLTDLETFAPRPKYADGVYAATPWPAHQPMCMHHELSYRLEVPSLLMFACLQAPRTGGATGLADASRVLDALPLDLVARFEREGWQLLRSYNGDVGASVKDAFGTDDRAAVERYCQVNGIEADWLPDGGLRTRQRRRAVMRHPVTGRRCWFNQVAFLSEWTLDPEVREYLVDVYGPDGLPFTTSFGDGDPITPDVVELLNHVYEAHTSREPWQSGDLLLVDNIGTAHSREPYDGEREVLVGMAEPIRVAASVATPRRAR